MDKDEVADKSARKKELDSLRTAWRKKHRTLNGRVILYSEKPPEHINARASKVHNWFWKKILMEITPQEIPAVIAGIQDQIKAESDPQKIRLFRTLIGMAEDAYQLKTLDDIKDYDTELQLGKKPVYNAELGVIYKDGKIFTADFSEDETRMFLRDIEGIIVDVFTEDEITDTTKMRTQRNNTYKNWDYTTKP